MREGSFVPASQLYDVGNQTPIAHPAHHATDGDVRRALEQQKSRAEESSDQLNDRNSVPPQGQSDPVPINRITPSGYRRVAYGVQQSVQMAMIRLASSMPLIECLRSANGFAVVPNWLGPLLDRSGEADTNHKPGGAR